MTYIIILAVIFIVALIAMAVSHSDEKKKKEAAILSRKDFVESKVVKDDTASFHFAVDETRQEVFCYSRSKTIRFKYQDLINVEITIDGESVVSSKSASVGGIVAGGLIAGGLGAVVGGASLGSSQSKKKATAINVHILLRNSTVDSFDIECLAYESKSDELWYINAIKDARAIFDILRVAMDKVQMANAQYVQTETYAPKSIVEEIKELAELKQQGLITEEEFVILKTKAINKVDKLAFK